jgi:hypothetical protein
MKQIILFIGIFLVGCTRHSGNVGLAHDSLSIKNVDSPMTSFFKDTLSFLSYNELMDYQIHEKLVIREILKYALSSEIRIIRNEMFARKGYVFKDQFLKQYFVTKDWYKAKITSIDSIKFSNSEQLLLDTLIVYEKRNHILTIDSFRNELKKVLLKHSSSQSISISLWKHVVGNYPRSTNLGVAPWDFLGNSYTLLHSDTTLGFYHCIVNFYCGAEGPDCVTQTIYVLDKNLNLKSQTDLDFTINEIKQISKGSYSYSASVDKGDENYVFQKGTYKILNTGKIEIKNNR